MAYLDMSEDIDSSVRCNDELLDVDECFFNAESSEAVTFIFERKLSHERRFANLERVFSENLLAAVQTASSLRLLAVRTAYHSGFSALLGVSTMAGTVLGPKEGLSERINKILDDAKRND